MRNLTAQVATLSLIGLSIVAGTAHAAGATTRPPTFGLTVTSLSASRFAPDTGSLPKAEITGEGRTAVFAPTAMKMAEDTSGHDCSPFIDEAKIKNDGTAIAYLTRNGSPFATLKPDHAEGICAYGYGAGKKFVFGLSNEKGTKTFPSTVTITTSD